MSNDKVEATFHPDDERAQIAEARGKRHEPIPKNHGGLGYDPSKGPNPPQHMDED